MLINDDFLPKNLNKFTAENKIVNEILALDEFFNRTVFIVDENYNPNNDLVELMNDILKENLVEIE